MAQALTQDELALIRADEDLYQTRDITLGSALTNEEFIMTGRILIVMQLDVECQCRFNSRDADPIDLSAVRMVGLPFERIYLTTTETSSNDLKLLIATSLTTATFQALTSTVLATPAGADYDARYPIDSLTALDSTSDNINNGGSYTTAVAVDVTKYEAVTVVVTADQSLTAGVIQTPDGGGTYKTEMKVPTILSHLDTFTFPVTQPYVQMYLKNNSGTNTTSLAAFLYGHIRYNFQTTPVYMLRSNGAVTTTNSNKTLTIPGGVPIKIHRIECIIYDASDFTDSDVEILIRDDSMGLIPVKHYSGTVATTDLAGVYGAAMYISQHEWSPDAGDTLCHLAPGYRTVDHVVVIRLNCGAGTAAYVARIYYSFLG